MRSSIAWVLSSALIVVPGLALARKSPVALAEVHAPARGNLQTSAVRATVEEELGALDLAGAKKSAILTVSVVRLESVATPKGVETTCVVSATLRTEGGQALLAVLEGHAKALGTGAPSLERAALRGAVHGAVARIPEALK
jgi:hypothetical protein